MKQWNRGLYIGTLFILIVLFLISYINLSAFEQQYQVFNISVIINEKEDVYWKNIRKGMDQAAFENQADLNFITLYDDNSTLQQIDLMKREIENGADAVIISPANNEALTKGFDQMVVKVPVVLIKSGILSNKVSAVIAPNNFLMGQEIGEELLNESKNDNNMTNILILTDFLVRSDIMDRYKGLVSILEHHNMNYQVRELTGREAVEKYIQGLINRKENYTMIALEEKYLHWLGETAAEQPILPDIMIYGIGSNNQIISLLENQVINSIVAPDNYDIGYFSVQKAIESIRNGNSRAEITIDSILVYPDTIYNKENEKRLFPI